MGEAGPARRKVTKDLLSNLLLNPVTPWTPPTSGEHITGRARPREICLREQAG